MSGKQQIMENSILVVAPAGYETRILLSGHDQEFMLAEDIRYQGGGHGGNLAYYLSLIGVKCALYTHWGDDLAGREAEKGLSEVGVDLSLCRRIPGATSQSNYVLVSGGEKRVIMNFGTALSADPERLPDGLLPPYLYTSLLPKQPSFEFIKKAKEQGSTVILGLQLPTSITRGQGLHHNDLLKALSLADCFIGSASVVNSEFGTVLPADELAIELCQRFRNLVTCVITDAERGCCGVWRGELYQQEGFQVEVEDTTGAGDQFTALFIKEHFLKKGNFDQALWMAGACSAAACRLAGSRVLVRESEVSGLFKNKR
ncbi:MAG: carbohydrate kinase family protein [Firmicutes bacterium]|nr:carbohydrate kinase family protein [Bacillota bacterium]